jgi:hypothetical protein
VRIARITRGGRRRVGARRQLDAVDVGELGDRGQLGLRRRRERLAARLRAARERGAHLRERAIVGAAERGSQRAHVQLRVQLVEAVRAIARDGGERSAAASLCGRATVIACGPALRSCTTSLGTRRRVGAGGRSDAQRETRGGGAASERARRDAHSIHPTPAPSPSVACSAA